MDQKNKVVVDTDFMNYMTRGKDGLDYYFNKIVADMNVEPVVHEFLYNKEMMGNPLVRKLVEEHKLTVMKYEDFLDDQMTHIIVACLQIYIDIVMNGN